MGLPRWTVCPGCGLALPDAASPRDVASPRDAAPARDAPLARDRRRNASAACWRLYGEVLGYESQHIAVLGRLHQLTVDAYGAQHAGGGTPPIGPTFGLLGLRLALEDGWTGRQVRDAHLYLARTFRDWPTWDPPPRPAQLTVFDVAGAGSPEAHADSVERWARAVWASWTAEHGRVAALVGALLPPDVRQRFLAGG